MENNIGIMCYQSLLEMEVEHQKINEMIMAPKFAKLLNESVDKTDLSLHRSKTIEAVSEFVNKSLDNTTNLLDTITEQLENINSNNRLIMACEMKMKSLTRDDRNNFLLENSNIYDSLLEFRDPLIEGTIRIEAELRKILETSFESKEEYSKKMNTFKNIVFEYTAKLDKIDINNMTKTDVSITEVSNILNNYKDTKSFIESEVSVFKSTSENINKFKEIVNSHKDLVKIKEAVYLGTEYLMRANSVLDKITNVACENAENILSEFVSYKMSDEATIQFESAIANIIRQESLDDDDYDDFIK